MNEAEWLVCADPMLMTDFLGIRLANGNGDCVLELEVRQKLDIAWILLTISKLS
jgi:hypothetical protein